MCQYSDMVIRFWDASPHRMVGFNDGKCMFNLTQHLMPSPRSSEDETLLKKGLLMM